MADDPGQSKTEAPTPRRREQARDKGQVARSGDLSSGLTLLAGTLILWVSGDALGAELLEMLRLDLLQLTPADWTFDRISNTTAAAMVQILHVVGVLSGALLVLGVLIDGIQAGFRITWEPLKPDWSRLSPVKGWSRIFSISSVIKGAMALLKLAVVCMVAWWIVGGQPNRIAVSGHGSLRQAVQNAWDLGIGLAIAIAAGMVLVGLLDYLYQRWKYEQDLKMSRQEVQDERKQEEGDPHVRGRIKQMQRELAQNQMIRDVASATVVLTNPTHYAVALQYKGGSMATPKVIAKGAGVLAKRITKVARENDIPVLERKMLARTLYAAVDVGQEIPVTLYQAIAEILAYVMRL